jgi:heterodisulfide reductase subunit C
LKTINYQFREEVNRELSGFSYNYCYQCGACVGDCPAHRFLPEFNPRSIILQALLGMEDELVGSESLIWNCTNCYNCYERCPQAVHPIEVIIALKNISRRRETNPPSVNNIIERVKKDGLTVTSTSLIQKRREDLGLPEVRFDCMDDLKKLLKE